MNRKTTTQLPDAAATPIAVAAFGLGALGLIPALLVLAVLASVSIVGVRFAWQLLQILLS
jgi:hypothetical protein